ncbi:MAG: PBP1A family penicillin-binding protein [Verrucomicrobiota bacterium]
MGAKSKRLYSTKPPRFRWPLRLLFGTAIFAILFLAAFALGVVLIYGYIASRHDISDLARMPQRSVVYDRNGEVIGRLHGANRTVVSLDQISPFFVDALIAREDSRFFKHNGVDFIGVARATVRNLEDKTYAQGASTITMQLARNSYLNQDKNLHRKLVEIMIARRIEREYEKEQILTAYCNRIFFGTGLYGIDRAAHAYFRKSPASLTLSESAIIVGIIRAPNRFSPFRHYERALAERNTVLDRMLELGFVTPGEVATAKQSRPQIHTNEIEKTQDNYALGTVRRFLDKFLENNDIEDGGFAIHTTLDLKLQNATEQAIENRLRTLENSPGYQHRTKARYAESFNPDDPQKTDYVQGAAVVLDNETGGILAVVGGRDFAHNQFNRALTARRQIGSTFKPFVYAAAFENGLMPGTLVDDSAVREDELAGFNAHWSPRNADNKFLGLQPAREGLVHSRNTMTVRVGQYAGIENIIDIARRFDLAATAPNSPQTYIGNLGVNLKTLTSAYSVFPNEGILRRPFLISRIERIDGGDAVRATPVVEQSAISPGASWITSQILQQVMTRGTGQNAQRLGLTVPAGGKTGTTDNYTDAWFVGYTSGVSCGVWVGLDDPKTIIDRGYGGTLALPIWTDIVTATQSLGYPAAAFPTQLRRTQVELCNVTGHLAADHCRKHRNAYTTTIPFSMLPKDPCTSHTPNPQLSQSQDSRPGLIKRFLNAFD